MVFRLIDKHWEKEFSDACQADKSALRIICPFIKEGVIKSFLSGYPVGTIEVITRFNLADFVQGVSDTAALRILIGKNAKVRGIKNLHAKVFLFGKSRVIVTSANLTTAALNRNHEFGFASEDAFVIDEAQRYFDRLWVLARPNLNLGQLEVWEKRIETYLATGARSRPPKGLGDEGANAGLLPEPPTLSPWSDNSRQAFVKFLGEGSSRAPSTLGTVEEINRAFCHWAVAYPASKRPTGVREGALIFISRLTANPTDIRVFGRAIAMRHVPGRDDATASDIAERPWKKKWPRYIRVHHAEFVSGNMLNGVSLYELMTALGSDSFVSTQRNAKSGRGNIDPRQAYSQQAAAQLTPQALSWVNGRLEGAFSKYGKVSAAALDRAGWPKLPMRGPSGW